MDWETTKYLGNLAIQVLSLIVAVCYSLMHLPGWDLKCFDCGHLKAKHVLYRKSCIIGGCRCQRFASATEIAARTQKRRALGRARLRRAIERLDRYLGNPK